MSKRPPTPTVRTEQDSKLGKKGTVGRPERDFDPKIFENLCRALCTVDEIEAILNTHQRTLDKWCKREFGKTFQKAYQDFMCHGKASLRRTQFKLAEKNAGMAIFLGKNILGQTDQTVQKIEKTEEVTERTILDLPDNGHR
jgi:hypothetical protein